MHQTVPIDCDACGTPYAIELCDVVDLGSAPMLRGRLMRGTLNFALCPHCGDAAMTDHPFLVLDPAAGRTILFVPDEGAGAGVDAAILRNILSIHQTADPQPYLENHVTATEWNQLVVLLAEGLAE